MSLPLPLPDLTETLAARGALTAYSTLPEPFTPAQQQLAEHIAAQAAGALALVLQIASRIGRLAAAVADQSMINIAVGILMARDADNEHQALSVLHAQAAAHHVAITEIAADLIAETSTR